MTGSVLASAVALLAVPLLVGLGHVNVQHELALCAWRIVLPGCCAALHKSSARVCARHSLVSIRTVTLLGCLGLCRRNAPKHPFGMRTRHTYQYVYTYLSICCITHLCVACSGRRLRFRPCPLLASSTSHSSTYLRSWQLATGAEELP